jgi:hypothetical protein
MGRCPLTEGSRRRWLSFGYRCLRAACLRAACLRAAWTILKELRQHLPLEGDDLPSAARRIVEQARPLCCSGLTATSYYSFRRCRSENAWEDKALFLGFSEGGSWQVALNRWDATHLVFDKLRGIVRLLLILGGAHGSIIFAPIG